MRQSTLFDADDLGTDAYGRPVAERRPAPHNGTRTSKAAAKSIEPKSETLRREVLDYLRARGEQGATNDEIERALAISGNTVRPRVVELREAGYVRDSGRTRQTPSGRSAVVWVSCGGEAI